ncbi:hypothetical protein Srubr_77540 [Streptomyces rubradiris]|uniref:Uncharacterized protein n=1 Tax=Streptomyces rubradiris TaxID=285531 RepID=A0ABQ3RPX2_STRRR|nr:hypothetical protein GCM10018792_48970 [Streptomyces rubradiris]GHI57908.1 hypothetical protein Srubr_77540 [Streptomyces rubradiris]
MIRLEPIAVEGCRVCAVNSRSRAIARDAGVPTAVAYCDAEIRNHPHRSPIVRRPLRALGIAA